MIAFRFRILGALALATAVAFGAHAQTAAKKAEPATKAAPATSSSAPRVTLDTAIGNITIELDAERSPKTVENFLQYVKTGHYDGTVFHRVIDNFMIQGGGFTCRHEGKADPRADPARSQQRPQEQTRHGGDGAHRRSQFRQRAVLHQRRRQRVPRLPKFESDTTVETRGGRAWCRPARSSTVTRCSVAWSKAWTWSTRSAPCRPATGSDQNVPTQPVTIKSAKLAK